MGLNLLLDIAALIASVGVLLTGLALWRTACLLATGHDLASLLSERTMNWFLRIARRRDQQGRIKRFW